MRIRATKPGEPIFSFGFGYVGKSRKPALQPLTEELVRASIDRLLQIEEIKGLGIWSEDGDRGFSIDKHEGQPMLSFLPETRIESGRREEAAIRDAFKELDIVPSEDEVEGNIGKIGECRSLVYPVSADPKE